MAKDYYEILGVPRKASQKQIKQAYRRLARKCHPDVNPGDKGAEERFKEIAEAHEVLSDPKKRKAYDEGGPAFFQAEGGGPRTGAGGGYRVYRTDGKEGSVDFEFFARFGDFGSIFSTIFGREREGGRETATRGSFKGEDITEDVETDFRTAVKGGYTFITIRVQEVCSTCRGAGNLEGKLCTNCQGAGIVVRSERIRVKIPEGVQTGSMIRVREKGMAGRGGGPRGNLMVKVRVRGHNYFERKGDDIYANLPVTITEAYCGGEVTATTIHGRVKLKVPARTQNGSLIRIRGKGVKNLKTNSHGDHYCRIQVMIPDKESEVAKDYMRRLSDYYWGDIRAGLPDSV